jgi:hypothetical protein
MTVKKFFFIRADNLADKGYNAAVEVYSLNPGEYPKFVIGNYQLDTAGWSGEGVEARRVVAASTTHKLLNSYRDTWVGDTVQVRDIQGII